MFFPDKESMMRYPASMIYRLILIFCILSAGCRSLNEVRFTANPSPLDYAQFRCTRISPQSGREETLRLDLSGSGFLEITTGRSERVRDPFWKPSEDPEWQDIRRDQVFLSPQETAVIFQALVDAGIFNHRHDPKDHPPPHHLAVLVSVGARKKLLLTSHPSYLRIVDALLDRLSRP